MAMASPDYPVTPGYRYQVSYLLGGATSRLTVTVQEDFSVNFGDWGILDARGMLFPEFRRTVENIIKTKFPDGFPSVIMLSPGLFPFRVGGEVTQNANLSGWGLSRLSEVLENRLTRFGSIRDVEIHDAQGNVRVFDLFQAKRSENSEDDPYLKAGDRIRVKRVEREITITGEVHRPGTYQLKDSDSIIEVIEFYGDGLTPLADKMNILIERPITSSSPLGESLYIKIQSAEDFPQVEIKHLDKIIVNSVLVDRAVVFFEGAINIRGESMSSVEDREITNRLRYSFNPGTKLSTAIIDLRESFTQVSDLTKAYIRRTTDGRTIHIPVDLESLLRSKDQDVELMHGDYIIIPFRQYFVIVAGAVKNPGKFPFVPDRTWRYYVNLAGGIDSDRNAGEAAEIASKDDVVRSKDEFIQLIISSG